MKFVSLFVGLVCLGISACQQTGKHTGSVVGSDRDDHQCIGSAGYTWSALKQECIRPFELPVQLISADSTRSAGVVFSADQQQAELFVDGKPHLLTGKPGGPYADTIPSVLKQEGGKWHYLTMTTVAAGKAVVTYTER